MSKELQGRGVGRGKRKSKNTRDIRTHMRRGNERKKRNKNIKLGICGEHGGDPSSIFFCSKVGLDYVSCSPYRVPIARLAAAQAEIKKYKLN